MPLPPSVASFCIVKSLVDCSFIVVGWTYDMVSYLSLLGCKLQFTGTLIFSHIWSGICTISGACSLVDPINDLDAM